MVVEIEAENEGERAKWEEMRANDGTPRAPNLPGWLKKKKQEKASYQRRAFQEKGCGQRYLRVGRRQMDKN